MISEPQARKYCYEDISKIENYEEAVSDTEHKWHCHHRVETIMNCGMRELVAKGCYYHRPAHELMFLRHDVHMSLHVKGNESRYHKMHLLRVRHHTAETKSKLSNLRKGKFNNPSQSKQTRMKRVSDGLVKVFPSMAEAARWLNQNGYPRARPSRLHAAIHGRNRSAYGALWSYLDSSSN